MKDEKHNNSTCPVCGSRDAEGTHIEVFPNGCYQPCWCNECGAEWNDVYEFVRCDDIFEKED